MKKIFTTIATILSITAYSQITDTGDEVGIGTSNPEEKLHIKNSISNLRLESTEDGTDVVHNSIQLYSNKISSGDKTIGKLAGYSKSSDGSFTERATIEFKTDLEHGNYWRPPTNILFKTNGDNEDNLSTRMIINYLGQVGIGTVEPSVNLHISDTESKIRLESISSTASTNEIEFYSGKISSGDKTIGKLAGYSETSDGSFIERATIEFKTDLEHGYYWQPPTNILFKTNGDNTNDLATRMLIDYSGNVGIGTISPDYKLDVIGTIRAREIKVDLNGADFVFESGYKLRALEEVESFVKENKHLPEIEPASEMEANGAELGELNTKLLQKIEELTLYLIEINKEVKTLKQENADLKEEIKDMKSIQ